MAILDKLTGNDASALEEKLQSKAESLSAAHDALSNAEATLSNLHDEDATEAKLKKAEADVISAKQKVERAERSYDSTHAKLVIMQNAQRTKQQQENIKLRDKALKQRLDASKELDALAPKLADILKVFIETDETLRLGMVNGSVTHAARGTFGASRTQSYINQFLTVAGIPGFNMKLGSTIQEQVRDANKTIRLENQSRSKLIEKGNSDKEPIVIGEDAKRLAPETPQVKDIPYVSKPVDAPSTIKWS